MKNFKIGDLNIKIPIIQGGMGVGISLSGLASAVANQGGIGVISAASIGLVGNKETGNNRIANIEALKTEIQKAKEKTKGVIGVNIMVALNNFADMVKTSIDEGIDIIFSGAGLPLDLPKYLKEGAQTKLVPIVSSAKAAKVICAKWLNTYNYLPDAVVVEGPKAGGHLGFKPDQLDKEEFQLETLVPEVVATVKDFEEKHSKKIPVIAAGGIYSGEDIYKFINMGASAVQMGTRFVATEECDASQEYKEYYINATKEDVGIIKSPVGMPGRAIFNSFLRESALGKNIPLKCEHQCIKTCNFQKSLYCISKALIEAQLGNIKKGFAFAGSNVHRLNEIVPVKDLFETLKDEYKQAYKKFKDHL